MIDALQTASTQIAKLALDAAALRHQAIAHNIANVYKIKMAAVFMISLSTVTWLTATVPRWLSLLGYTLALFLLFGASYFDWAFLTFPIWVLMVSGFILIENYTHAPGQS